MRQEARGKERELSKLMNTATDCERLMLSNRDCLMEYVEQLDNEMATVKEDLVEVEAKNRLYSLLGERTRQEHLASEQKVRASREMRKNCRDDVCTLSRTYHETCSLKEDAEKHLDKMKKMYSEIQKDWQRKLKDRRKEVRRIRRLQTKEKERDERKRMRRLEKEEADVAMKAEKERERQELECRVQALMPKIESMEATWSRLCSVSRAASCEDVIEFWNGLKEKKKAMQELVTIKEDEQIRAQTELRELAQIRTCMLEDNPITPSIITPNTQTIKPTTMEPPKSSIARVEKATASTIRVVQGLLMTLHRLASEVGDDYLFDDEDGDVTELASLYEAAARQIIRLKEKASKSQHVEEAVSGNSIEAMTNLSRQLRWNVGDTDDRRERFCVSSSERRSLARRRSSLDVTKLVGYVDEEQDNRRRKKASNVDDPREDDVVERSFLKARSMRFAIRGNRNREA